MILNNTENKLTVLLSAMNLEDDSIVRELNISGDVVIINQSDHADDNMTESDMQKIRMITVPERGLSKSRNRALRAAKEEGAEICIFCDNDVQYVQDYQKKILDAFKRHPESDLLVFFIERPERHSPIFDRERQMGRLSTMKIFSPEVAFRLSSLREKNIVLDEAFGAGAKYAMGEENIFLWDCLKNGLKITYIPERIAGLIPNESTWFKGYDRIFFRNRGAGYYRMSRVLWPLLCIQFAVRKKALFGGQVSVMQAVRWMFRGKKEYAEEQNISNRR